MLEVLEQELLSVTGDGGLGAYKTKVIGREDLRYFLQRVVSEF